MARTAESRDPGSVAGPLAGVGHHKGCLASVGLEGGPLEATVESGSQPEGSGRETVDQIARVGGAGGTWVPHTAPKGAGREVFRADTVGHVERM
jgi:hypothetical protein